LANFKAACSIASVWTLSEDVKGALARVHRNTVRPAIPWRRASRVRAVTEAFEEIGESREWRAIPSLLGHILDLRPWVADGAGRSVSRLLYEIGPLDVVSFDAGFRNDSPYWRPNPERWHHLRVDEVPAIAERESGPALLCLAMCHPNGYVREASLGYAISRPVPQQIPFLVLRTNDWVEPVRTAARQAFRTRLNDTHIGDFVRHLPLVDSMQSWSRSGIEKLALEIDVALGTSEAVRHLLASLSRPESSSRWAAYRRLLNTPHLDSDAIIERALNDDDASLRGSIIRELVGSTPSRFVRYSERLMRAPTGRVRFATLSRRRAMGLTVPWRRFLLDSHTGVRRSAQDLAIDADCDPAEIYRKVISESRGRRLGVALIGLAETGTAEDAEQIRAFVGDESSQVRRSTLRALVRIKAADAVDWVVAGLHDCKPSVSRAARDLICSTRIKPPIESVWAAFEAAPSPVGKTHALKAMNSLAHWAKLPYLLRATTSVDGKVRECVLSALWKWVLDSNRFFTTPDENAEQAVRSALEKAELPEGLRGAIETILER